MVKAKDKFLEQFTAEKETTDLIFESATRKHYGFKNKASTATGASYTISAGTHIGSRVKSATRRGMIRARGTSEQRGTEHSKKDPVGAFLSRAKKKSYKAKRSYKTSLSEFADITSPADARVAALALLKWMRDGGLGPDVQNYLTTFEKAQADPAAMDFRVLKPKLISQALAVRRAAEASPYKNLIGKLVPAPTAATASRLLGRPFWPNSRAMLSYLEKIVGDPDVQALVQQPDVQAKAKEAPNDPALAQLQPGAQNVAKTAETQAIGDLISNDLGSFVKQTEDAYRSFAVLSWIRQGGIGDAAKEYVSAWDQMAKQRGGVSFNDAAAQFTKLKGMVDKEITARKDLTPPQKELLMRLLPGAYDTQAIPGKKFWPSLKDFYNVFERNAQNPALQTLYNSPYIHQLADEFVQKPAVGFARLKGANVNEIIRRNQEAIGNRDEMQELYDAVSNMRSLRGKATRELHQALKNERTFTELENPEWAREDKMLESMEGGEGEEESLGRELRGAEALKYFARAKYDEDSPVVQKVLMNTENPLKLRLIGALGPTIGLRAFSNIYKGMYSPDVQDEIARRLPYLYETGRDIGRNQLALEVMKLYHPDLIPEEVEAIAKPFFDEAYQRRNEDITASPQEFLSLNNNELPTDARRLVSAMRQKLYSAAEPGSYETMRSLGPVFDRLKDIEQKYYAADAKLKLSELQKDPIKNMQAQREMARAKNDAYDIMKQGVQDESSGFNTALKLIFPGATSDVIRQSLSQPTPTMIQEPTAPRELEFSKFREREDVLRRTAENLRNEVDELKTSVIRGKKPVKISTEEFKMLDLPETTTAPSSVIGYEDITPEEMKALVPVLKQKQLEYENVVSQLFTKKADQQYIDLALQNLYPSSKIEDLMPEQIARVKHLATEYRSGETGGVRSPASAAAAVRRHRESVAKSQSYENTLGNYLDAVEKQPVPPKYHDFLASRDQEYVGKITGQIMNSLVDDAKAESVNHLLKSELTNYRALPNAKIDYDDATSAISVTYDGVDPVTNREGKVTENLGQVMLSNSGKMLWVKDGNAKEITTPEALITSNIIQRYKDATPEELEAAYVQNKDAMRRSLVPTPEESVASKTLRFLAALKNPAPDPDVAGMKPTLHRWIDESRFEENARIMDVKDRYNLALALSGQGDSPSMFKTVRENNLLPGAGKFTYKTWEAHARPMQSRHWEFHREFKEGAKVPESVEDYRTKIVAQKHRPDLSVKRAATMTPAQENLAVNVREAISPDLRSAPVSEETVQKISSQLPEMAPAGPEKPVEVRARPIASVPAKKQADHMPQEAAKGQETLTGKEFDITKTKAPAVATEVAAPKRNIASLGPKQARMAEYQDACEAYLAKHAEFGGWLGRPTGGRSTTGEKRRAEAGKFLGQGGEGSGMGLRAKIGARAHVHGLHEFMRPAQRKMQDLKPQNQIRKTIEEMTAPGMNEKNNQPQSTAINSKPGSFAGQKPYKTLYKMLITPKDLQSDGNLVK